MSKALRRLVPIAVAAASLVAPVSAQAGLLTLGSSLAVSSPGMCSTAGGCTIPQISLTEAGTRVQSPVNGAIVKWRVKGASNVSGYAIRVLQRGEGLNFTGAGTSASATPAGAGIETFATNLPIQAGQYIGINLPNGGAINLGPGTGTYGFITPTLADGASALAAEQGAEVAFNAEVQPAPAISAVTPLSGPASGGTSVKITGTDFEGATGVKFGSTPASSFHLDSESQITAVAPSAAAGLVDVSVTTNAGTSEKTGSDRFEYIAVPAPVIAPRCVVPNLIGMKLKAARKRASKANCKVGKVKKLGGATPKSGEIVKQKPKQGKTAAAGTKIAVTLRAKQS